MQSISAQVASSPLGSELLTGRSFPRENARRRDLNGDLFLDSWTIGDPKNWWSIPEDEGVYAYIHPERGVLYVGLSRRLRSRCYHHPIGRVVLALFPEATILWKALPWKKARELERRAIFRFAPILNIQCKERE